MKKYDVYGLGNALVDMEFEVEDSFLELMRVDKGIMTLVDEEEQHRLMTHLDAFEGNKASGGSAANTLIAVAAMGGSSYYTCKVADDDLGQFYLNDLKDAGVDTNMNGTHPNGITGKCLVMITPDAERTMHSFLGISSELSVAELHKEHIANSEYCYMEGYLVTSPCAKEANIEARKIAEANGVKTAFTFSDPGIVEFFGDQLTETIGDGIDLLFCNEHEAMQYTKKDNVTDAIEVIKTFSKNFAITLGAEGAAVYDGTTLYDIAAHDVKAIDTNGAGDNFAGAFLYGITHGMNYQQAGDLASKTAAQVITDFGPRLKPEEYRKLVQS
ncbi:MAG: adenosine kinase [Gammaproteobacteria bacterium]|nr:adenosine kinase [Gammaproteobacteria bacterium]MCK5262684.1 adenosine kinase [Gammaproteobacteria bacterium]